MKRIVEKPERVALCRRCHGTGIEHPLDLVEGKVCRQCEGSGRVRVSCKMELEISAYKEVKK